MSGDPEGQGSRRDRVRIWQWRRTPDSTAEDVEARFDERALSIQPDVFGGAKGRFRLDPAGAALVLAALETTPDPTDGLVPARSLKQRRADQLVAIADHCLNGTPLASDTGGPHTTDPQSTDDHRVGGGCGCGGSEPSGARQTGRRSVGICSYRFDTKAGVGTVLVRHLMASTHHVWPTCGAGLQLGDAGDPQRVAAGDPASGSSLPVRWL